MKKFKLLVWLLFIFSYFNYVNAEDITLTSMYLCNQREIGNVTDNGIIYTGLNSYNAMNVVIKGINDTNTNNCGNIIFAPGDNSEINRPFILGNYAYYFVVIHQGVYKYSYYRKLVTDISNNTSIGELVLDGTDTNWIEIKNINKETGIIYYETYYNGKRRLFKKDLNDIGGKGIELVNGDTYPGVSVAGVQELNNNEIIIIFNSEGHRGRGYLYKYTISSGYLDKLVNNFRVTNFSISKDKDYILFSDRIWNYNYGDVREIYRVNLSDKSVIKLADSNRHIYSILDNSNYVYCKFDGWGCQYFKKVQGTSTDIDGDLISPGQIYSFQYIGDKLVMVTDMGGTLGRGVYVDGEKYSSSIGGIIGLKGIFSHLENPRAKAFARPSLNPSSVPLRKGSGNLSQMPSLRYGSEKTHFNSGLAKARGFKPIVWK